MHLMPFPLTDDDVELVEEPPQKKSKGPGVKRSSSVSISGQDKKKADDGELRQFSFSACFHTIYLNWQALINLTVGCNESISDPVAAAKKQQGAC